MKPLDIYNNFYIIESDFQREYSVNLRTELDDMSWDRFTSLLAGLSRRSRYFEDTQIEHSKPFTFPAFDPTKETRVEYQHRRTQAYFDYLESHPEQRKKPSNNPHKIRY